MPRGFNCSPSRVGRLGAARVGKLSQDEWSAGHAVHVPAQADVQISRAAGHWARNGGTLLFLFIMGAMATGLSQNAPNGNAGGAQAVEGAEVHLGRGYGDLRNNRYDDAIAEFRAALALDPSLVLRARFPLAVALFESQKPDEARREFDAVRAVAGDAPDVLYYLGRIDLTQGNLDQAAQELGKAAAKPPFPDTAYYLGSTYLRKGDLAAAEKWLDTAERATPRDPHVEERLAALYRQESRAGDAQKALARAAELRDSDAQADRLRLDCIQALGSSSPEAARPVCERLFDPADAARLTMLGTIYGEHGDFDDALRPLRRAAELEPSSPQMQYNLALVCFRLKRYDEARTALLGAVKQWPDLFELNSLLGVVLYRLGDLEGAYQTLSHARALNPADRDSGAFLYEVSLVLADKRVVQTQYGTALACLKTAAGLRPQDPEPHRRMADVYAAMGQPGQAREEQQEAERLQKAADSK